MDCPQEGQAGQGSAVGQSGTGEDAVESPDPPHQANGTSPPVIGTGPGSNGTSPPVIGTRPGSNGTSPPVIGTRPGSNGTSPSKHALPSVAKETNFTDSQRNGAAPTEAATATPRSLGTPLEARGTADRLGGMEQIPNGEGGKSTETDRQEDEDRATDGEAEEKTSDTPAEGPHSEHSDVPIDRGWAWVVMMAHFTITTTLIGYGRSLTIYFLEFIDMFEVHVTTATIAFGVMTACFGVGNLVVSHALMPRFTARAIVLAGSCIGSTAIAITSLAPSMLFVIVMHCIVGACHAMMYVPPMTLLGHYFNKRRSLAMAVANTGVSVSALVFPPLVQALIEHFGARGALLLSAGFQMQAIVAACVLRPLSYWQRDKPATKPAQPAAEPAQPATKPAQPAKARSPKKASKRQSQGVGPEDVQLKDLTARLLDDVDRREVKLGSVPNLNTVHVPVPDADLDLDADLDMNPNPPDLNLNLKGRDLDAVLSEKQSALVPSAGVDDKDNDDVVSGLIKDDDVGSPKKEGQGEGCCCGVCPGCLGSLCDLSLCRSWLFRLIIVYAPLGLTGTFISFYFPSLGVGMGLPRADAALLLTVIGGVDLASRLILGYLADLELVSRTKLVAICMALLGLAAQFTKFYTTFGLLALFAVLFGLLGGACQNLLVVVVIDLVGLSGLGQTMGIVMMVNAAWASLTHPFIGLLVEVSGSFVVPFNYVGGCLFAASFVLLLEPFARRLEARREKATDDVTSNGGPA